jgi:two-component system, response regulator PdtaR
LKAPFSPLDLAFFVCQWKNSWFLIHTYWHGFYPIEAIKPINKIHSMSRIKILLVEDNEIIAFDLEALLTEWGYEVVGCATSGAAAVRLFQEFQPDLALVDVHLDDDMDGIATVQKFNTMRLIPIVYLTAQADVETVERAKSSSPVAYLLKPFDDRSLQISLELAFDVFAKHKSPLPTTEELHLTSANEVKLSADMILQNEDAIFIKHNYRFVKLKKDEIILIEADGNYSFLNTQHHRYLLRIPLATMIERLKNADLIRTHRSFAVNIKAVEEFRDSEISINGKKIPISAAYRDTFLKHFSVM